MTVEVAILGRPGGLCGRLAPRKKKQSSEQVLQFCLHQELSSGLVEQRWKPVIAL